MQKLQHFVLTYFKPDRNEGASNDCFSGVNEFLLLYNIFKTMYDYHYTTLLIQCRSAVQIAIVTFFTAIRLVSGSIHEIPSMSLM
jgi:hypothetical protein